MPIVKLSKSSASFSNTDLTKAVSSNISSSVTGNINLIQNQINLKSNDYINVKNAVKILENFSNSNGYIKLYTEVESNFYKGDTVYITYTEPTINVTTTFSLENPSTPFEKFYLGYKILSVNNFKNEIVINRYFNEIPAGKKLKEQYISKVSVKQSEFLDGTLDGVVLYDCGIHSGITFTQGVFKYCDISGITFSDKYSNIKTVTTTDNYNSKFSTSSQTTTSLSKNNSFYNRIEKCEIYESDVENGKFVDCNFYGLSGYTNYITDGIFSGCSFSGYTINGGKFYDCIVYENNLWENGFWDNARGTDDFHALWHDGVWNRGHFAASGWTGGTFNSGTFEYPAIWYNGIANGGTFSGITWYHGLVRNAVFTGSTFENGVFNKGTFNNSIFNGGVFNNGSMLNSNISGGTINDGTFSGCTVYDGTIRGGVFNNIIINYADVINMKLGSLLTVNGGNFYGGNFYGGKYNSGDIYNGSYNSISGTTSNLTIHNGTFMKGNFYNTHIHNGIFTNCYGNGLTWQYGVFNDGQMYYSTWNGGYMNDSLFTGSTINSVWNDGHFYGQNFWGKWNGGYFHYGYLNGVLYTERPRPKWVTTNQQAASSLPPAF